MIKTLPFKTLLLALMSVFSFGIMSTQAAAIVFADLNLENGVQYAVFHLKDIVSIYKLSQKKLSQ